MKKPLRRGFRLALLFFLLFALAAANTTAGAGRMSPASAENPGVAAKPNGGLVESVKLAGLYQSGDPPGADPELVKKLKQDARGSVSISTNKSTDFASFVRVDKNGDLLPGNTDQTPQGKAKGFFGQYGGLFGVSNASSELSEIAAFTDSKGASHVSYQQVYKGVPVFAAILKAHLSANNELTSMNGVFVPDIDLNANPKFSADEAAQRAIAEVLANPPENEATGAALNVSAGQLSAASSKLYVYRDGLIQNVAGPNYLVYEVEVTNGSSVREKVYLDAHTGKIVNRISQVHDALSRRLFEENTSNHVWQEGEAFPGSLNQDQHNIDAFSGES
jgi:Zn-dependent metalloprotease